MRSTNQCVSSCAYVNGTNLTSGNYTYQYCESANNASNCPYYKFIGSGLYQCTKTCDVQISGNVCCPSTLPLVSNQSSQLCINSCASTIYYKNESVNICNSTCDLPFGITSSKLSNSDSYLCGTCLFVMRINSSCVSSCNY